MKVIKWNIYEEIKTEEGIQAFEKIPIAEVENDTNPSLLALGVAV